MSKTPLENTGHVRSVMGCNSLSFGATKSDIFKFFTAISKRQTTYLNCFIYSLVYLIFGFGLTYPSNAAQMFDDWQQSGRPFAQHFDTVKIAGNPQNYSIKQDNKGYVYVGNGTGILIYNGNSWEVIKHGDQRRFRDFALAKDGKIYTGTSGQIGYFVADNKGHWSFVSLSDNVPKLPDLSLGILVVKIIGHEVYFASHSHLFYYNKQKGLRWIKKAVNPLDLIVNKDLTVLIASKDKKLYSFNPATEKLSVLIEQLEEPIIGFTKLDDNYIVAYTQTRLFHLNQDNNLLPIATETEQWQQENWINDIIPYTLGSMALGTEKGGVAILSLDGKLKRFYNNNHGLHSNNINKLFLDRENNLWVASASNGISRVELHSPLSYFSNSSEYSISTSTAIYNDKVYVTALEGLFELIPADSPAEQAYFKKSNINENTYLLSLMPDERELLIGHSSGVASLFNNEIKDISHSSLLGEKTDSGTHARQIIRSRLSSNIAYVASKSGLIQLLKKHGKWEYNGITPEMTKKIYSLVEDSKGDLWVGTSSGQFFLISNLDSWPNVGVRALDYPVAKPSTIANVFRLGNDILFNNGSGSGEVLSLTADEQSLSYSKLANWNEADIRWLMFLHQSKQDRAWFLSWDESHDMNRVGMLSLLPNEQYQIDLSAFDQLRLQFTLGIYESTDGIVWINGKDLIVRYNTNIATEEVKLKAPVLTKVEMLGSGDVLFSNSDFETDQNDIELKEDQNAIRITFTSAEFQHSQNTLFRYRLGSEAWTNWRRKASIELTNIEPNIQNFEVQYRINPIDLSPPLRFRLNRKPFFTEVWWGQLLLVLTSVILIGLLSTVFFTYRNKRVVTRAKLLKSLVLERTKTIEQQNLQLNEQNSQLLKLDEAKSNFFINIAHEFRTPLSLSIGPLKEIQSSGVLLDPKNERYLEIALRNNLHLLDLLGQVTDINRLEAGELPVKIVRVEIVHNLTRCISRFEFQIQELGLTIETVGFEESVIIDFDEEHFEKIILNLLSNAIKHSPSKGTIEIGLASKYQCPVLWIKDQGPGVSKTEQKHLFRRFYRGSSSIQNTQSSTGIGLSLVKELTDLHKISIAIENNDKQGACFVLTFNAPALLEAESNLATLMPNAIESDYAQKVVDLRLTDLKEGPLKGTKSDNLRKTVLIVDDNDELREFISSLLSKKYKVIEASDGKIALRLALKAEPDVIISDVMMPELDGFTLTQQLKSSPITDHIPLILLTAKATKLDTIKGLQLGADDYLSKPFDNEELMARVASLLAHSKRVAEKILGQVVEQPVQLPVLDASCGAPEDYFSKRLKSVLAENLGNLHFDVDEISQQMNTTRSTLFRKTKERFGCTPIKLLKTFRLKTALQMLKEERGSISEVGYAVGFHSLSSFGRAFNEFHKVPPSRYKEID
ncbi:MAG: response regulator [Xanthomonadales bacterium]|nr:response regulator [Xanthomonadales bacterium]